MEDELIETIRRCCPDENEKEKQLKYFAGVTVNEMIEQAFED